MKKLQLNNKGFGTVGVLAIIVVLAVAGGAGAYVWHRNYDKKTNTTTNSSSSTQTGGSSSTQGSGSATGTQQSYLVIKELGIRFKLSSTITSAYYTVKSSAKNGKPVVALYLHSLDAYPQCTPAKNSDGVAEVLNYTPGQTDPVNGDFSASYPNAPLIGGLHYYTANEQFDCSGGKSTDIAAIGQAFQAAYPTIEAYSSN